MVNWTKVIAQKPLSLQTDDRDNEQTYNIHPITTTKFVWLGQKKNICPFMVTRPTLIFASDPMNFYTEFG
jgi:hypothetical protein